MSTRYVYILGAGRSGTTVCALFLQKLSRVRLLGELNHLGEFMIGHRPCACGEPPEHCSLRSKIMSALSARSEWSSYADRSSEAEAHGRFFRNLAGATPAGVYTEANVNLARLFEEEVIIDSGKYVSRAVLLNRVLSGRVRFVWLTRDPRGVVYSFSKKVQSSRGSCSACLYYIAVNCMVLIAYVGPLRRKVFRLSYESLLADPHGTLAELGKFLGLAMDPDAGSGDGLRKLQRPTHMIGGNRLVAREELQLCLDEEWRRGLPRSMQLLIWLSCAPLCLLFGYRP